MSNTRLLKAAAALALAAGFAMPAAAQIAYDFSTSGNCNFPPATCNVPGSATVANSISISGWAAASGANFVAATLTDQGGSGVGMTSAGETGSSPDHAIDNNVNTELVLLNFGTNKVVVTGIATGWSNNDTDVALLRWNGSTGPDLSNTTVTGVAGLVAKGWQIVASADLDGVTGGTGADIAAKSATNLVTVNSANASSWWIVSSYFGGGTLDGGTADAAKDYFKLLSVSATCVSNTSGGTCNTTPPGRVPEPATLALAMAALAGVGFSRRKQRG